MIALIGQREAMTRMGIPAKLSRLVRMTYIGHKGKVALQNKMSEHFKIDTGLKQGDVLSMLLFNLALQKVIGDLDRGSIMYKTTQICAYADDIVIISRKEIELKDLFLRLEERAKEMGLRINENKTKYMRVTRKETDANNIEIGRYKFERTDNFKYLETIINKNSNVSEEIKEMLQASNRCYYAFKGLLTSKLLGRKTKLTLYKTLIRPVTVYSAECWRMTSLDKRILLAFERKIIRKIYDPLEKLMAHIE